MKSFTDNLSDENIFILKYLFFPINIYQYHWTLAIIFIETKEVRYYNSMILNRKKYLNALIQFIEDEYNHKGSFENEYLLGWKKK